LFSNNTMSFLSMSGRNLGKLAFGQTQICSIVVGKLMFFHFFLTMTNFSPFITTLLYKEAITRLMFAMLLFVNADCVIRKHDTSVGAVRQTIGSYLKMAPYRQGGAGKGAALATPEPDGDEVESDVEL
jgi:hypothetical protein